MNKIVFLVLLFLLSCTSHSSDKPKREREIPVKELSVVSGELDTPYHCMRIDVDVICIPRGWEEEQQKKYFYLSQLGDNDPNTYFVTIREEDLTEGFSEHENRLIEVSVKDSIETLKNYALTRLKYDSKKASFIEMDLRKHEKQYWAYCMLVEKNGVRYDFSLKVRHQQKELYYELFQSVLNSYMSNGIVLFDVADKLHSIEQKKTLD